MLLKLFVFDFASFSSVQTLYFPIFSGFLKRSRHVKYIWIISQTRTMFQSDTHIDIYRPRTSENGVEVETPVTKTQILAALAVSMGSMIVGFCSAWSSPAIASLQEDTSRFTVCYVKKSEFFHQKYVKR